VTIKTTDSPWLVHATRRVRCVYGPKNRSLALAANSLLFPCCSQGRDGDRCWFDWQGKQIGSIDRAGDYMDGPLSPDGTRVAVTRWDRANVNIRLLVGAGEGARASYANAASYADSQSRAESGVHAKGRI